MSQGLPLAGVLVWQNWQVKGLVLGLLVATCITASVFSTTIARVDWEKESRIAVERATKDRQRADAEQEDEQQQKKDDDGAEQADGGSGSAGKAGKEWYLEQKEDGRKDTDMAAAPVSPVRDYHSVAIEEEKKEPPRPLEHI